MLYFGYNLDNWYIFDGVDKFKNSYPCYYDESLLY